MLVSVGNNRRYEMPGDWCVPFSKTWRLVATCADHNLVHDWRIDGQSPDDHYMRPWAENQITVIGYELVVIGPPIAWMMIGSGHQPDGFLWAGRGETRARVDFAPHLGHPWMSRQDAEERRRAGHQDMIDLHGCCPAPRYRKFLRLFGVPLPSITALVTVYYISLDVEAGPPSR